MVNPKLVQTRPEDAGVDTEMLEAVFARARRDVDEGVLPSAQVAVARNGKLAGMRTFGEAVQGGELKPATDDTLYCIFSCTKVVVAAAVWLLFEEGLLRLDERVADIIPEFGTHGKEHVTVEQVMLHTGGFPLAPFPQDDWGDREKLLEAFARWRLNWEPDTDWQYHATSAHWVLSEIIYRRTGIDYKTFIRERITEPMGLGELFIGLPLEHQRRFAEVTWVSDPVEPPGGWGEVTPEAILGFNRPSVIAAGVPGGGGVTNAVELALFYQTLINGGEGANGTRVLKPETIEFATTVRTKDRHRDLVFDNPVNRGLSVVIAGGDGNAYMRGFGRTASARAFGHGGAGGQIGWGDPETGISVGYCTNGFTDFMTMARRITAISSLAGNCGR
ncbi:MAG TPA: serine hydrolase domain-containing protein [Dehalococcoidia bacterium]